MLDQANRNNSIHQESNDTANRGSGSGEINMTANNSNTLDKDDSANTALLTQKQNSEDVTQSQRAKRSFGRSESASDIISATNYVQKNKYGVAGGEDEEFDQDIIDKAEGKTPNTRRRIIKEENIKKQKKLGPMSTAFTIFKGFVCTGILYMPGDFVQGGYGFSAITVISALFLTLYCAKLLLEVYLEVGGSLPEIGFKVYGKPGKIAVDIALFSSQFGFVCAYIYFIASQIGGEDGIIQCITTDSTDLNTCAGGLLINRWWFFLICMVIYVPLVFVRKIEFFAVTHLFGDVMILVTIIALCVYAGIEIGDRPGLDTEGVNFIQKGTWPNAIGFSVYAFEGIGVILPIYEVTERKDIYLRILVITCAIIAIVYVVFSEYCLFAYGAVTLTKPLITDSLPPQSVVTWIIKICFSLNLVFSYPLVIHPANLVLESYLFSSWPKTRKRQMFKNITRTIIVASSCAMALLVWDNLTSFLSITGALTCTPIAFTLPALFHYKQCAKTTSQRVIDMSIVVGSTVVSLYCTTVAIIQF